MKATIKGYWNNLNPRERMVLAFGILFSALYLYYLVLYAPLANAVKRESEQLLEHHETLVWMENIQKTQHIKSKTVSLSSSQLLTVLANQLNTVSFKQFAYQLQQSGASEITLSFEQVPYAAFLAWIRSVSEAYAFTIKQLTVMRSETPGVVKLTIVMATTQDYTTK